APFESFDEKGAYRSWCSEGRDTLGKQGAPSSKPGEPAVATAKPGDVAKTDKTAIEEKKEVDKPAEEKKGRKERRGEEGGRINRRRVNPVFAMLDVGKSLDIVISRTGGPVKPEKILVLTTPFEGTEAQKAYMDKENINPSILTVPLVAKS
ncbi:hypothetical protein OSTOST_18339, partial [Ostertagia ostertagi]